MKNDTKYNRRQFLATSSVAIGGAITGCIAEQTDSLDSADTPTPTKTPMEGTDPPPETPIDPANLPGYVRPSDDPKKVPDELSCEDDEFRRAGRWTSDPSWGTVTDDAGEPIYALRVDTLTVERGETLTITFTNVSGEEREADNFFKNDFQLRTTTGWQEVRGWADGNVQPEVDVLEFHPPGWEEDWMVEMTEEGVVETLSSHSVRQVVCPGLPSGRYRFATKAPFVGDIAVAFDLVG